MKISLLKKQYRKWSNKGKFSIDGPFYFGILSNNLSGTTSDKGVLRIGNKGILSIGKNIRISSGCKIYVNGNLSIGDNTYINPNTMIFCDHGVTIGNNCAISWD